MPEPDSRRRTVDQLLVQARAAIHRRSPEAALACGAQIIDIRTGAQRAADGAIPGALWFERNVLEWRVDPVSDAHDPRVCGLDDELLVLCHEGYQSSLAAAALRELGFARAGDVVGGFRAWRAAGLPVEPSSDAPLARP
jgi:rhodanese-related sulfurtransferase